MPSRRSGTEWWPLTTRRRRAHMSTLQKPDTGPARVHMNDAGCEAAPHHPSRASRCQVTPNPETPSWAASLEGMRLSVRDELRSHAIPLILAARCWLLHVCVETRQAPFKLLAAACGPISPCCRMHACSLSLSMLLSCSQDDREAHQLCSGEDERAQRLHLVNRNFAGRDQDCVGIARQDDQSLGFWCAGALKSPLLGQN